jgi:CBS-domain-containing membrane protein
MLDKLKHRPEFITRITHRGQRRYGLKGELVLAALPIFTLLVVLFLIESFAHQRILFASLAAGSFLIYRDPHNQMNSFYSLLVSQTGGAVFGLISYLLFGPGYNAAGFAMVTASIFMITVNSLRPPAIATAIAFGFNEPDTNIFFLFFLALIMVGVLVILELLMLRLVRWADKGQKGTHRVQP